MSTHPDEDVSGFAEHSVEDRVCAIPTIAEDQRIWAFHQAPARLLRKDMSTVLKKMFKELDNIDFEDFVKSIEDHAVEVEKNFIRMFSSEDTKEFD